MKTAHTILFVGLDVHKDSIAVALAAQDGSVRRYGVIAGHIEAVDKLIKKLEKPGQELRLCYEAGQPAQVSVGASLLPGPSR